MKKVFLALIVSAGLGAVTLHAQTVAKTTGNRQATWRPDNPTWANSQVFWRQDERRRAMPPPEKVCPPREDDGGKHRRRETVVIWTVAPAHYVAYDLYESPAAYQERQDYYQPGYEWGTGLRNNDLDWAALVPYLEKYLLMASPNAQWAFREGFVKGFGGNGEETYDRAFRQACRPG